MRWPKNSSNMDLFGPISIRSIGGKSYCLVVTDDYSRFSWVKFLATKDETAETVQFLILGLENLCKQNVRRIKSDNGRVGFMPRSEVLDDSIFADSESDQSDKIEALMDIDDVNLSDDDEDDGDSMEVEIEKDNNDVTYEGEGVEITSRLMKNIISPKISFEFQDQMFGNEAWIMKHLKLKSLTLLLKNQSKKKLHSYIDIRV
ncbi:hypothetical protein L1987_43286 [Smallanthus sonchifolius]|uniref:Uncharacterized protein n=1 Tax=Smallanthus sonchifolius TaxID=185202 RepID=A0ACB9GL73_9ASTR|nr:hypothetical protein L1987_43286 [Smallanthus sonchifolius]